MHDARTRGASSGTRRIVSLLAGWSTDIATDMPRDRRAKSASRREFGLGADTTQWPGYRRCYARSVSELEPVSTLSVRGNAILIRQFEVEVVAGPDKGKRAQSQND